MDLRITACSYDLFDTLITRRAIRPARVFEDVEQTLGASGFANARVHAERALAQTGRSFDLHDIYRHMVATGVCGDDVAAKLKAAEVDAEFDHAEPVAENLARVREFDLVVSDMYLPAEILRRLLWHVGLRVHVHLFVGNDHKRRGSIWPTLAQRFAIVGHLGDDPAADVESPTRHGIPARHFTGTRLAPVEQRLDTLGCVELAGIVRALRLRCPHRADSAEASLWQAFAQLNVPLLCLAAFAVERERRELGAACVLFSARDCHYLAEIFGLMFPQVRTGYLPTSRKVLADARQEMAAILEGYPADALIVDIAATGRSWRGFAEAMRRPVRLFAVVRIDHYLSGTAVGEAVDDGEFLRFRSMLRNSRLPRYTNAIEALNGVGYGTAVSLARVGDRIVPEMERGSEMPAHFAGLLLDVQAHAMQLLRKGRRRLLEESATDALDLAGDLIEAMSAHPLLVELGRRLHP